MSIKLMSLVYESGLDKSLKAIALAYADHAQDDGTNIYPSVAHTAWKTGYSERTVQRLTKELVDSGVLVRHGYGPSFTNRYKMDTKALPVRPHWGGDILTPQCHTEPEGVTTTTERGVTMTPKPSLIIKEPKDDDPLRELADYFADRAGKKVPRLDTKRARTFWLDPLIYVYKHHGSDYAETKRAIYASVLYMQENGLTIATPKSIQNIATAGKADKAGDYVGGVLTVTTR